MFKIYNFKIANSTTVLKYLKLSKFTFLSMSSILEESDKCIIALINLYLFGQFVLIGKFVNV